MSELDLEAVVARAIDARLDSIKKPLDLIKWLIGGAFALGVWVATLQLSVAQAVADVRRIDNEQRETRTQMQTLTSDMAVTKSTVIEIKDSVKEMRTDIKGWTGR